MRPHRRRTRPGPTDGSSPPAATGTLSRVTSHCRLCGQERPSPGNDRLGLDRDREGRRPAKSSAHLWSTAAPKRSAPETSARSPELISRRQHRARPSATAHGGLMRAWQARTPRTAPAVAREETQAIIRVQDPDGTARHTPQGAGVRWRAVDLRQTEDRGDPVTGGTTRARADAGAPPHARVATPAIRTAPPGPAVGRAGAPVGIARTTKWNGAWPTGPRWIWTAGSRRTSPGATGVLDTTTRHSEHLQKASPTYAGGWVGGGQWADRRRGRGIRQAQRTLWGAGAVEHPDELASGPGMMSQGCRSTWARTPDPNGP